MSSVTRKPERRRALEAPHQLDHDRSVRHRMQQPTRLRDYIRELQDAVESETMAVARLHQSGVEWEPGAGGSALGTPRWTAAFRAYVTGNDCDTTHDGDWRWPLRSSLFRMSISRSGRHRSAAAFVFLLMRNRFHVSDAWAKQCGPFADPAIAPAADDVALAWLSIWWAYYVELPHGKPLA